MSNIQVDMYFWQVLEVKYKSNSVPWLKEHAARYLRKLRENWRIKRKKNHLEKVSHAFILAWFETYDVTHNGQEFICQTDFKLSKHIYLVELDNNTKIILQQRNIAYLAECMCIEIQDELLESKVVFASQILQFQG